MKTKRIILWGGWYGSRNLGDRALLLAITDMLDVALKKVHFVVLSATPLEVYRYTRQDTRSDIEAIRTKDFLKTIFEIAKADVFVFGGATPISQNIGQLLAMFGLTFWARLFNTPYFLWSVSSLQITSELAKKIIGFVLSGAAVITCRDEHTRSLFSECGISQDRMEKVPDAVFSFRRGRKEGATWLLNDAGWLASECMRPLFALTPRFLRNKDGEAETHYHPESGGYYEHEVDTFAEVLDWLWENNYQPIFVPMNTMAPDDDRLASREIMARSKYGGKALIIDREISPRFAVSIYEHCVGSFVARVHGSITSFVANCPPVMYAFDHKHKGIMDVMDMGSFVFDPKVLSPADAIVVVEKLLVSIDIVKKKIGIKYNDLHRDSYVPQTKMIDLLGLQE